MKVQVGVLLGLLVTLTVCLPQQPQNPIIALQANKPSDCGTPPPGASMCVISKYVNWLEAAGIRVVPLRWNASNEERNELYRNVNGVLFPGSGRLSQADYEAYVITVKNTVKQALTWNAQGDPFVVWGTCMGFEIICGVVAKNMSVIEPGFVGLDLKMLPLDFTPEQPASRMFGVRTTPANILRILSTENSTLNWHGFGVTPNGFASNPPLRATLKPLATSNDANGRTFVSALEGVNAAIYATQFHPEKIQFDFTHDRIAHTDEDIKVSEWLALFLAQQLKKNNHSYSNPSAAEAQSVHNYPVVNYGYGSEAYWLP